MILINSLKEMNENDLKARITEDKLRLKKLKFAHAISPLGKSFEHPRCKKRYCPFKN